MGIMFNNFKSFLYSWFESVIFGVIFASGIIWVRWDQFIYRRLDDNTTWVLDVFCKTEVLLCLIILVVLDFIYSEVGGNLKRALWRYRLVIIYMSRLYTIVFFIRWTDGHWCNRASGGNSTLMFVCGACPGDYYDPMNSGIIKIRDLSVTPWGDGLLTLEEYVAVPADAVPVDAVVVAPANEEVPVVDVVVPAADVAVPGDADVVGFAHNIAVVPYRAPIESPNSVESFTSLLLSGRFDVVIPPFSISFLLGDSEHPWLNPNVFGHGNYIVVALSYEPVVLYHEPVVDSRMPFEKFENLLASGRYQVVIPPLSIGFLRDHRWLNLSPHATTVPSLPWYVFNVTEQELRLWEFLYFVVTRQMFDDFGDPMEAVLNNIIAANNRRKLPALIKAYGEARDLGYKLDIPWSFIKEEVFSLYKSKSVTCTDVIVWTDFQADLLRDIKWPWTILPNDGYWLSVKGSAYAGYWCPLAPPTQEDFDRLDEFPGNVLQSTVLGPKTWGWRTK